MQLEDRLNTTRQCKIMTVFEALLPSWQRDQSLCWPVAMDEMIRGLG